jgi:hypothetical protein
MSFVSILALVRCSVFNHGFCCVRVSFIFGLRLLCGARFPTEIYTPEDAIGSHAFAPPLEALACVRPIAFLSGVHCLLPVGTVNSVQTLKVDFYRRTPLVKVRCPF